MATVTSKSFSRRSFFGLAGLTGAAAGMAALAGCSSDEGAAQGGAAEQPVDNVSPIEPLAVPEAWDGEFDIVVAGTGGGLAAALRGAELGARVVCFDPSSSWGGSSKETDIFAVVGTKYQTKMFEAIDMEAMGMPGVTLAQVFDQTMGGHDEATMKAIMGASYLPQPGGSVASAAGVSSPSSDGSMAVKSVPVQGHAEVVQAILDSTADQMDWMIEKIAPYGVTMGPVTMYGSSGMMFLCPEGAEEGGFVARTNYTAYEALYNACVDAGVEFRFNTAVTGLVVDNGAVVGVQASDGTFVKAGKGVVLATGGFGANEDMLQRYCAAWYNGCFTSSTTMNDDGSGIRMGMGLGSPIAGIDSANVFDGGVMTPNFNHYLYKGDVQWARNVPSLFNIRGERVPWYSLYTLGFSEAAPALMGQPGGYGIAVADADNYVKIMDESTEPICRKPITPEMMAAAGSNADRLPEALCERDWRIGFEQGLEGGWIVSADTIDELAAKLEVNADNLKKGIDSWNAACEAGVDEMYALDAALLRPIKTAPFYACKVNGTILNTWCGLTCDFNTSAVLDATGTPIPGLYAGGAAMGGMSGTGGNTAHPGGGASFALATCWVAANSIMGA